MAEVYNRFEKKYIISKTQYELLLTKIKNFVVEDTHGESTVCNVYFDTENYDLISRSIEKPSFKEKVRVRSYNIPSSESTVYLEIKRKYKNHVGKRRIEICLEDFKQYIIDSSTLSNVNSQIKSELDYIFKLYDLKPSVYISYFRKAYYANNDFGFRITFDNKLIARNYDLSIENGSYGVNILEDDFYIMEVKTLSSIPIWFVQILDELKIYPVSFSKYGKAYEKVILKKK